MDLNGILELLSPVIVQVLSIVLLALAGVFARWAATWMKNKGIVEAIMAKEELALIAVQFVEQAFKAFDGGEKFDAAYTWLENSAKKYGLKISMEEIEALIESAVREMKMAWLEVVKE